MITAQFRLISTDPATLTASYRVDGDFSPTPGVLRALIGKSVYAMGAEPAVGRVVNAASGSGGAVVVIKVTDAKVAKKVGHGVLSCGQCRVTKAGALGSFNITDAPLAHDELHKAAGLTAKRPMTESERLAKRVIDGVADLRRRADENARALESINGHRSRLETLFSELHGIKKTVERMEAAKRQQAEWRRLVTSSQEGRA